MSDRIFERAASAISDLETYDRLLKASLREIQSVLERQVEQAFAHLPDDPFAPLPWIGGGFSMERSRQKKVVIAALTCRQWAKFELPRWAPRLPLKLTDIRALWNTGHQGSPLMRERLDLVGQYAERLREHWWDYSTVDRFEIFCAHRLAPPPSTY
jgi:hypothetical protein